MAAARLAVGVGLETKYTLAVVVVLLLAAFCVWRRDLLRPPGFPLAVATAVALLVPNLIWQAGHGWTSVHFFLHPPPSATDESRPQYLVDLLLLTYLMAVPVAVAGALALVRGRALRPLGWTVIGTVVAYLVLAASRTTRCRWCCSPSLPAQSPSTGGRHAGGWAGWGRRS